MKGIKKVYWGGYPEPIEFFDRGDIQMERALEDLFFNSKFLQEIKEFRLANKLPKRGYTSLLAYAKARKKKGLDKKITAQALKMAKARGLPDLYARWIESFIGVGFESVEYLIPFYPKQIIPGYAYELEWAKDHWNIRMYKGGTIKGLIRFIKFFSDALLDSVKNDAGKVPTVRGVSQSKRKRNEQILKLHLNGLLTVDGVWKDKNTPSPDFLEGISIEQRRKVIQVSKRKYKAIKRFGRNREVE